MSATVSGLQTPPASASATSSAQPLSTPSTPSPSRSDASTVASTKGGISKAQAAAVGREATQQRQPSSLSAGTVMKGLNISKTGQDPVALKDDDYPGWLFDLVNPAAKNLAAANTAAAAAGEQQGAGLGIDIAEKKEMRRRNREAIKRRNFFAGRL